MITEYTTLVCEVTIFSLVIPTSSGTKFETKTLNANEALLFFNV